LLVFPGYQKQDVLQLLEVLVRGDDLLCLSSRHVDQFTLEFDQVGDVCDLVEVDEAIGRDELLAEAADCVMALAVELLGFVYGAELNFAGVEADVV